MKKIWLLSACLVATSALSAQTTSNVTAPFDKTIEVSPSSRGWTDSGIDVSSGDVVEISATTIHGNNNPCDPQGLAAASTSSGNLPVNSALPGALIATLAAKLAKETSSTPAWGGRVADPQLAGILFIGIERHLRISQGGRLFFGSNLDTPLPCTGKYSVKIHVVRGSANEALSIKSKLGSAAQIWMNGQFGGAKTQTQNAGIASDAAAGSEAAAATATRPAATSVEALTVSRTSLDGAFATDLQSLPRRVNDEFKNLGDMVNFVLVGSEKQVQDALMEANWHVADTSNNDAVTKAVLMATQKKDYLQMPMSQLYLFGRVQDFGYEQAEPYAMVASRHHFRIWKSSLTYNGLPVWAGAGTHDIGFEKDQRNGKLTHKIDPKVDGERDHIGKSLLQAGTVKVMTYFMPSDPVQDARNATGGGYESDGRVLVIFLR